MDVRPPRQAGDLPEAGVREVWYWRKGQLTPYELRGEHYEKLTASEVLTGIDLDQLASFLERPTTSQSIREYRAALVAK